MEKDKDEKEARQTPIIDGDARPDMPIDPEKNPAKEKRKQPGDKEKFKSERGGDVNSLEDFKDAK